jgi:hypothetical protein
MLSIQAHLAFVRLVAAAALAERSLITETRRAEVARAKPASLAASTHVLATSCTEQVILAAPLNALATCDVGRDGRQAELWPPIFAGFSCIKVAAWSAIVVTIDVCTVLGICLDREGRSLLSMQHSSSGSVEDTRSR